jgi:hypothetical protein
VSRGTAKEIGDHFTNQNGYTYEKREAGWVPIHICIAESNLGRRLEPNERAYYVDGDRTNHAPENIGVKIVYSKASPQARLVALEADIQDAKDKLEELLVQREALAAEIAATKV